MTLSTVTLQSAAGLSVTGTCSQLCSAAARARALTSLGGVQQLLGTPRFAEALDCSAVLAAVTPALHDRRLDNDTDVYKCAPPPV